MKRTILVLSAVLLSSPVMAMPPGALGKWTTKKGDCRNEERIVRIETKRYSEFEQVCKVKKVDGIETYGVTDYRVSLICDSEGEIGHKTVWIASPTDDGQLKVQSTDMKNNEFQWLYRCKR